MGTLSDPFPDLEKAIFRRLSSQSEPIQLSLTQVSEVVRHLNENRVGDVMDAVALIKKGGRDPSSDELRVIINFCACRSKLPGFGLSSRILLG